MKYIRLLSKVSILGMIMPFFTSKLNAQCPSDKCVTSTGTCIATEAELSICDITPSFTPKVSITVIPSFPIGNNFGLRIISTNGIPNHTIGDFGTTKMKPCGRPTSLEEQKETSYEIPLYPNILETGSKEYIPIDALTPFGIAINGILFDPAAAEWYKCNPETGWQKSALDHPDMKNDLDCNNAHIQPDGAYHYHGLPVGLYKNEGGEYPIPKDLSFGSKNKKMVLLGWGFDGVPVYGPLCNKISFSLTSENLWKPESGYTLRERKTIIIDEKTDSRTDGHTVLLKDICEPSDAYKGYYDEDYEYTGGINKLDKCNGHFSATPEKPEGIYHYHITLNYPYIPRCYTKMK